MLKSQQELNFSQYTDLYDKLIPQDHLFRKINELIDFSFIRDELKDKYCPDNGRTAEDPEYLFKFLFLKCLHPMSDVDLVERALYDLSYKYIYEIFLSKIWLFFQVLKLETFFSGLFFNAFLFL